MTDAPTPPTPPTPPPAPPWHQGAEPDMLGFWQNKGYDLADPGKLAIEVTKQYRQAERHIGAPPDQILRLPKDATDEAGWKAVYGRLGVPDEAGWKAVYGRLGVPDDAKEYDFSTVKNAAGEAIDPKLADALRAAALDARVPKDRAGTIAAAVQKHLDGQRLEAETIAAGKLAAEKAALAASWGNNSDFNKLTAMQGAKRLGVDPDTVAKLEGELGYAKVMEMFRKIGAGTSEDTFVTPGQGGRGPATTEGAAARLAELENDKAWVGRLLANDATTRREWEALTTQIAGVAA